MKNTIAIGIPDKVGRAERDRKLKKTKVIEFDLPKGYSAEDAFLTAMWWIDNATIFDYEYNFLWWSDIARHFEVNFLDEMSKYDRANFLLLLLAAANGHKLE